MSAIFKLSMDVLIPLIFLGMLRYSIQAPCSVPPLNLPTEENFQENELTKKSSVEDEHEVVKEKNEVVKKIELKGASEGKSGGGEIIASNFFEDYQKFYSCPGKTNCESKKKPLNSTSGKSGSSFFSSQWSDFSFFDSWSNFSGFSFFWKLLCNPYARFLIFAFLLYLNFRYGSSLSQNKYVDFLGEFQISTPVLFAILFLIYYFKAMIIFWLFLIRMGLIVMIYFFDLSHVHNHDFGKKDKRMKLGDVSSPQRIDQTNLPFHQQQMFPSYFILSPPSIPLHTLQSQNDHSSSSIACSSPYIYNGNILPTHSSAPFLHIAPSLVPPLGAIDERETSVFENS